MGNDRDEAIPHTDGLAHREPEEIVLRAERVVAPAPAPEIRDLEYNRQAPTKPEMFPYGVDWWMVALAIVVVIFFVIVPLIAIFGPKYPRTPNQHARVTAAKADIAALVLDINQFANDTGQYPSASVGLQALRQAPENIPNWEGPYAQAIPNDPWGMQYQYVYLGIHNTGSYDLSSAGPDKKFGTGDDIVNW